MLNFKQQSSGRITFISLGALVIGHLITTVNLPISFIGIILAALFIFHFTLRRNDFFSFIMVIYFTNHFNYFAGYGGAFNIIAFFSIFIFMLINKRLPFEMRSQQKSLNILIYLFLLSSILGWSVNFVGEMRHLIISILSFLGIILILFVSTRLYITKVRIIIFLKISLTLTVYSVLASLNSYLNLFPFKTPMMPIRPEQSISIFDFGGVFGNSPVYGEQSMLMIMLFITYLLFSRNMYLSKKSLYLGVILSFVNVFFSVSRSAFILAFTGLLLVFIFQYKITPVNIRKQASTILIILFTSFAVIQTVNFLELDYVFDRLAAFEDQYYNSGGAGLTSDRIFDGSIFGRKESFDLGYERYYSKDNWLIGYGWGTSDNNRYAFYSDISVKQGSAHSQIFAVLFLFGWIGLFAYFGLYFLSIYKSFQISGSKVSGVNDNRLFAFSFALMLLLFMINEIKVDSISLQYYFGATIILLGLSFANINTYDLINKSKTSAKNFISK